MLQVSVKHLPKGLGGSNPSTGTKLIMNTKKTKYTYEKLKEAVDLSKSMRDVLHSFNLKYSGGNYSYIKRLIDYFQINISHFDSNYWKTDLILRKRRKYQTEDLLKNNVNYPSNDLKKRLFKEGYKEQKCEICSNEFWNNSPIPLELHHKDGNHLNNELNNLQILCPNCHALTPSHKKIKNTNGRFYELDLTKYIHKNDYIKDNKKIKIIRNSIIYEKKCLTCENTFSSKKINQIFCSKSCKCKMQAKNFSKIPKKEILLQDIKELKSNVQVGKKYGVSDNTIKKWKIKLSII